MQCRELPAPAWTTVLTKATSGSAFLQFCKALLSFRYSLQGTTLKCSKNGESTTRLCFPSTFPLAPSPRSMANPGELRPLRMLEKGRKEALAHRMEGETEIQERVSLCPPMAHLRSEICRYAVHTEHVAEAEELPPKIWAASKLRQGQMSLTFTSFQEQKSLGSLPLTGEMAQNLFSFQSPPRGKKASISMQVYLFCVFLILYFTNQCQLSVIESRHSC